MEPKQFTTSKGTVMPILMPDVMTKDVFVAGNYLAFKRLAGPKKWIKFMGISGLPGLDYHEWYQDGRKLPPGNWQFIEETEEVLKGVVDSYFGNGFHWREYTLPNDCDGYELKSALESYQSLKQSMQLPDGKYVWLFATLNTSPIKNK